MCIFEMLESHAQWEAFLAYKESGGHLPANAFADLRSFVENKEYMPVVAAVRKGSPFPLPQVSLLNKKHTGKKRIVFTFDREENYLLKMIAFLLQSYDGLFSENLYSFRQNIGVKRAIFDIAGVPGIDKMYCYKADIRDYFNSVDPQMMSALLQKYLQQDAALVRFLTALLSEPCALKDGEVCTVKKGIMAGVPISGFLANLYLAELDSRFAQRNVVYARYSDDIVVFAKTQEELTQYVQEIKAFLSRRKLEINPEKEAYTLPGQPWEFLGFCYQNGEVDVSAVAAEKLKGKMRRKARALLRWKERKQATDARAIKAFIRHFNKKLYDNPVLNDITWCRWYFSVITTDKSLKMLDAYMLECIRYIATGKHTKANYNLRYETIKAYGFKSLVNAYYKKDEKILDK